LDRAKAGNNLAAMATTAVPGPSPVAGLRYVTDAMPGIRRRRAGRGFTYFDPDGARIDDEETLARVRALAVPPAWMDVWICPYPTGHLQATGRDARGRKQYRYHHRWRTVRDETKFERLAEFAAALTPIRRRVQRDLVSDGLTREKVLATVVRVMDTAFARIGNLEYARDNRSFGLTTLRDRHVEIRGDEVRFEFAGKGGRVHAFGLEDEHLARIVRRCRELPGQELFQYLDREGRRRPIGSSDVNDYVRETAGGEFTAKDFRTWAGTVIAAKALVVMGPASSKRQAGRNVNRAMIVVGQSLGNTPAIARASYVHPIVVEAYLDGTLTDSWERPLPRRAPRYAARLRADEQRVLRLLRSQQRAVAGRAG
jgi:DNA topoisomerase I